MAEYLIAIWALSGVVVHVLRCHGKSHTIWDEPETWLMFLPAMIVGPLLFIIESS